MPPLRDHLLPDPRRHVVDAEPGATAPTAPGPAGEAVMDRAIGDILAELKSLSAEQVERVLQHQRASGLRFGEAAVALGLASREDVLFALSRQFHYPYAADRQRDASPELVTLTEPFGPRAEHFRALRSQLMMRVFTEGQPRRALAVISPDTQDGKTYCACNLAVVLAQLGGRTLLIDADLRGPRVHEVFRIEARTGLSALLSGRTDGPAVHQLESLPGLYLLPVGVTPPNPLELIERSAFALLVREMTAKFDHVIVDTPAAIYGADASVIAARCGAALLVARKDRARIEALQSLALSFSGSPAQVAGVVVNEF